MDKSLFTQNSPGKLVQIETPVRDWAFVPDEMPPKWEFPADLWPLLASAKEALGTLNGIGQTLPNPELLLRPLQNKEAISSSSIEGTYVTPEQLLLYELDPREPRRGDEKMADGMEVFNYSRALIHGCQRLCELPLCSRLVKEMHGVLMRGVRGANKSPGEFRRMQVQIGSRGRFIPPPATEVARLMDNLEAYMNSDSGIDPLIFSFLVHYQFETIHPFRDGNGRVGRLLLALMIYTKMRHAMPWLYLSAYFENFREEYVDRLFRISSDGDWSGWIEFCLSGTIHQANDSIKRCARFNALRAEFHDRIEAHSPRTHKIIESLFSSPVVTIASLAKKLEVAYHTARTDVRRLVEARILSELKGSHPRSYCSPEIMRIAYHDLDESRASDASADNAT